MASKLERNERKEFVVRPTIATDGLAAYRDAFEVAFGNEADFGMMVKRYSKLGSNGEPLPSSRYIGADRIPVTGSPEKADIHTAHIERQNLNLRMGNRRYTRRSNGFSKTLLNHERQLALWIMYHNLCWMPRPSRPRRDETGAGSKQWIKRLPAAMAAGLETRLWEVEDLLALTDAFTTSKREIPDNDNSDAQVDAATTSFVDKCDEASLLYAKCDSPAPTHFVYHSHVHHSTKVHAANCCNCRGGKGKKDAKKPSSGEWLAFHSLEAAEEAAAALQPDRNSMCNVCLGSYRTLGYRHAGSSRQSSAA